MRERTRVIALTILVVAVALVPTTIALLRATGHL